MRRLTTMLVLILAAVCSQPGAADEGLVVGKAAARQPVWGPQEGPPGSAAPKGGQSAAACWPAAAGDSQLPASRGPVSQAVCLQPVPGLAPSASGGAGTDQALGSGRRASETTAAARGTPAANPASPSVRLHKPAAQPPLPLARPGESPSDSGWGSRGTLGSMVTVGASLAVVLGLLLAVAWLLRRAAPKSLAPLPQEVVEVLGRAPLAGRQQLHLLRCGSKLLLVSVTPAGAETLTEITDPAEVDRLAGLCQQARPGSTTEAFRQVFEQFTGRYSTGRAEGSEFEATYRKRAGAARFDEPAERFHD